MDSNEFVLVTGASGYIASHIVKQLLEQGYKVRGTVRNLKDEKKVSHLKDLVGSPKYPLELCEANLLEEQCWSKAIEGCTVVMHTASPLPNFIPSDGENVLIKPAVDGTINVLKACVLPNSRVKRVVLTSSIVAIYGNVENNRKYSENDWTDPQTAKPYEKSKTLAEKAAWHFVSERKKNGLPCFDLAVINPGYVMGPLLQNSECTSMEVTKRLLEHQTPMIPNIYFPTCDVRDVALAHIRAMQIPEAANNRHIIATTIDSISFKDYAVILQEEFSSKGYRITTTVAPNFLIMFLSCFDKTLKLITPLLGIKYKTDNSRMKNILKIEPIDLKKSLIDMAYSMIEKGLIKN